MTDETTRYTDASTQPMPRAVIFDFDGTLGDSYAAITASVNHVRAARGLAPLDEQAVRRHVGRGLACLLERTLPGPVVEADLAGYRAHHPSVMRAGTRLLPGVVESLAALKAAGMQLAVCSNKPGAYTAELVCHLGLAPFFDLVLGPEDVARPKPAPDMLQKVLDHFHLTPREALYVGDMVIDIETARAIAMPVWVVPTGSEGQIELLRARPDRLIQDLRELPVLLLGTGNRAR